MDLTKDGVINPEEWMALVHRNPGAPRQGWAGGRAGGMECVGQGHLGLNPKKGPISPPTAHSTFPPLPQT